MCQPGGAGGEGETPAVGQRALAARGTTGPTSWRDRDVYKARLKHLHSPEKQESIMDARACRGQGRGEVRWLHPEVRAGGAGDTELSCLLEKRVGMVLLGSVHREKRGAWLQCVRGLGLLCSSAIPAAAAWLSDWGRSSACKASCSSWRAWEKPSEQRAGFGDTIW